MKKYFCIECGRTIKRKLTPWCDSCRIIEYQKRKKNKYKKKEIPVSGEPNPGSVVC